MIVSRCVVQLLFIYISVIFITVSINDRNIGAGEGWHIFFNEASKAATQIRKYTESFQAF